MSLNPEDLTLHVHEVSVTYNNGHEALRDVSFVLRSGMICALVGMNGSGKSSLFKTIMGFIKPISGSVSIGGLPVKKAQKEQWIAYVPQTEEVDWNFPVSVWDVVMMGRYGHMNFFRIPSAEDKRLVEESLKRVNLLEFKHRQIGELSGGQKKRVFLARALAQQSPIILLDEPFTGVDVQTEDAIIELLKQLGDEGQIILVSTHNLGSVPEFCDHVILIRQKLLAFGPTEEMFTQSNLSKAFGGALRHITFDHTDRPDDDRNEVVLISDDESPLLLGADGLPKRRDGKTATETSKLES